MKFSAAFFGAVIGFVLTHSIYGLLVGGLIGYYFSRSSTAFNQPASPAIAEVFFRSTFNFMGHVAKADGRVSESEIQAARHLMQELKLGADQVARAIDFFQAGKAPGFDAQASLEQLRRACGYRQDLLRVFVELQLRAAVLGNGATGAAHTLLVRCAERLGLSGAEFLHLEAMVRTQYRARSGAGSQSRAGTYSRPSSLENAYRELEITATASDQEVKKAYRRQMNRHHPDKLVANGLPESMAEVAKEKTQRIQEAYEAICAARGIR